MKYNMVTCDESVTYSHNILVTNVNACMSFSCASVKLLFYNIYFHHNLKQKSKLLN